jgi:hypothetical protein
MLFCHKLVLELEEENPSNIYSGKMIFVGKAPALMRTMKCREKKQSNYILVLEEKKTSTKKNKFPRSLIKLFTEQMVFYLFYFH